MRVGGDEGVWFIIIKQEHGVAFMSVRFSNFYAYQTLTAKNKKKKLKKQKKCGG